LPSNTTLQSGTTIKVLGNSSLIVANGGVINNYYGQLIFDPNSICDSENSTGSVTIVNHKAISNTYTLDQTHDISRCKFTLQESTSRDGTVVGTPRTAAHSPIPVKTEVTCTDNLFNLLQTNEHNQAGKTLALISDSENSTINLKPGMTDESALSIPMSISNKQNGGEYGQSLSLNNAQYEFSGNNSDFEDKMVTVTKSKVTFQNAENSFFKNAPVSVSGRDSEIILNCNSDFSVKKGVVISNGAKITTTTTNIGAPPTIHFNKLQIGDDFN
jgi:hypothetical protein